MSGPSKKPASAASPRRSPAEAHTAGPWKACRAHEDYDGPLWDIEPEDRADYDSRPVTRITAADGTSVASAHDLFEFTPANARLIAAAPELLEALQAAADTFTDLGMMSRVLGKQFMAESCSIAERYCRELITKATGAATERTP